MSLRSFSNNFIDVNVYGENVGSVWRLTGFYDTPYANNKLDS